MRPKPFPFPIYVTRPILPSLESYANQLRDVWASQWLTNGGSKHQALELALGKLFETPNLTLFNNGTIALITACQALRLSGEVITTPFTFPATVHVLAWNNIVPVFCDIDAASMTLNVERLESMITSRTTAILGVHVYGIPCDVLGIQRIADCHGLRVIYDAAHAFLTRVNGKLVTRFGDISMFSFHATKLFHTAEGGALITQDPSVTERINLLKNFGIRDETTVLLPGINGKMNELQAALGLLTLDMVEQERVARQAIVSIYANRLRTVDGLSMPTVDLNPFEASLQYFPIRISSERFGKSRDRVYEELKTFNVFARKYFFPLCSDYPIYRMLPSADPKHLPISHHVANEVLVLPLYGGLAEEEVHRICDIMNYITRN